MLGASEPARARTRFDLCLCWFCFCVCPLDPSPRHNQPNLLPTLYLLSVQPSVSSHTSSTYVNTTTVIIFFAVFVCRHCPRGQLRGGRRGCQRPLLPGVPRQRPGGHAAGVGRRRARAVPPPGFGVHLRVCAGHVVVGDCLRVAAAGRGARRQRGAAQGARVAGLGVRHVRGEGGLGGDVYVFFFFKKKIKSIVS